MKASPIRAKALTAAKKRELAPEPSQGRPTLEEPPARARATSVFPDVPCPKCGHTMQHNAKKYWCKRHYQFWLADGLPRFTWITGRKKPCFDISPEAVKEHSDIMHIFSAARHLADRHMKLSVARHQGGTSEARIRH